MTVVEGAGGGTISVNVDQLNILYTDGLTAYSNAASAYSEGAGSANSAGNFLFNADANEYINKAGGSSDEMSSYLMILVANSTLIDSGHDVFAAKIAFLLYSLGDIDESVYSELSTYFDMIKKLSEEDLKKFDEINYAKYDKVKAYIDDMNKNIDDYKNMTKEELLKELGVDDEAIKKLLETLGSTNVDESNFDMQSVLNAFIFIASSAFTKDVPGAGADLYWMETDNRLWGACTPLASVCDKYLGGGYGGVVASLTIGSLIALQGLVNGEDMSKVTEKFFEEGVAAATGATLAAAVSSLLLDTGITYAAGYAATYGLIDAGAGAIMASVGGLAAFSLASGGIAVVAAALGVVVTTVTSKFIHAVNYYPGDVPKNFEAWDEEKQAKYLKEQYGIDMTKIKVTKGVADSDYFTNEQKEEIINYFSGKYNDEEPSNVLIAASHYYEAYDVIQKCETEQDLKDQINGLICRMGICDSTSEDYQEIYNYMMEIHDTIAKGGETNE